jgi:hypothetical protein
MSDGQILYEAYRAACGEEAHWNHLFEADRIVWEESALAMEQHYAQRMFAKLGRMAAEPDAARAVRAVEP